MPTLSTITPCLWFDHQGEEAAKFYTSLFKNSKITQITRYTEAGKEFHGKEPGSVLTVAFELDGQLFVADDLPRLERVLGKLPEIRERSVRFRTLGCWPLTGAVESDAATLPEVIQEMLLTTTSERQGRVIDKDGGDASMEKKKQEGYF